MNKNNFFTFILLMSFAGNASAGLFFKTKEEKARAEAVKYDKKKTECLFKNKDIRKQPTPGCEPFAPDMKKRADDLAKQKNDAIKLCKERVKMWECPQYQAGLSKEDASVSKRIEKCDEFTWEYDQGISDASSDSWDKAGFAANCAKNVGKGAVDGAVGLGTAVVGGVQKLGEAMYRQESIFGDLFQDEGTKKVNEMYGTEKQKADAKYSRETSYYQQAKDKVGAMYNKSVDDMSIKLMCYTPRAREEFWCEYIGTGFVDAVGGDMAFKAAAKLAKMAGVAVKAKVAAKAQVAAAKTTATTEKAAETTAKATTTTTKTASAVQKSTPASVPNEAASSFRSLERSAESSGNFSAASKVADDIPSPGTANFADDIPSPSAAKFADDIPTPSSTAAAKVADDIPSPSPSSSAAAKVADDVHTVPTKVADAPVAKVAAHTDEATDAAAAAKKVQMEKSVADGTKVQKEMEEAAKARSVAEAPARQAAAEKAAAAAKQTEDAAAAARVAEFDKRMAGTAGKTDDVVDAGVDTAKKTADDAAEASKVAAEKARKEGLQANALEADKKYQAALKEKQIAEAPARAAAAENAAAAAKQTEDAAAAARVAEFDKRMAGAASKADDPVKASADTARKAADDTAEAGKVAAEKTRREGLDARALDADKKYQAALKEQQAARAPAKAEAPLAKADAAPAIEPKMAAKPKTEIEEMVQRGRDSGYSDASLMKGKSAARPPTEIEEIANAGRKTGYSDGLLMNGKSAPKSASEIENIANAGRRNGFSDDLLMKGKSSQPIAEVDNIANAGRKNGFSDGQLMNGKSNAASNSARAESKVVKVETVTAPKVTPSTDSTTKVVNKAEFDAKVAEGMSGQTKMQKEAMERSAAANAAKSVPDDVKSLINKTEFDNKVAEGMAGQRKIQAEALQRSPASAPSPAPAPAPAPKSMAKIERDNSAYKFEAGERVTIPRSDGTFSNGVINKQFTNADGSKSFEVTFNTPQGPASKVLTTEQLNSGYSKLYKQTDSAVSKAATSNETSSAATAAAKVETKNVAKIERDNSAYKFEAGERVSVPRSDGTFSSGVINKQFTNADGSKSFEVTFNTPQGPASKVLTTEQLNNGYSKLYKETDSAVTKVAEPYKAPASTETAATEAVDATNGKKKLKVGADANGLRKVAGSAPEESFLSLEDADNTPEGRAKKNKRKNERTEPRAP